MNQAVYPELPGTKPPTKEYTWRDPWTSQTTKICSEDPSHLKEAENSQTT